MPRPAGQRAARVRYEVRPHPSVRGLLSVVALDGSPHPQTILNLGAPALPELADAVNDYLAHHATDPEPPATITVLPTTEERGTRS